ncbi:Bug family tripartite tricarboxylate transporter substrate binding protein [Comamonas testosteroni]|uniref:Bug family tripartite tricarboxylate transporter substrate binding protein n=1 Tax=Comamonas testosteroni TaxID=285 RepID=UPI00389A010E
MRRNRTPWRLPARLCALALSTTALFANAAWPEKPVTIVAPFPAGGNADVLARQIGHALSISLKQPVIVENRPGAGGMLGSLYVARSKPDGYTFLIGALSNVLNEFFYAKKLLDTRKDLVAVSQIVSIPNWLGVSQSSKYSNMKELIEGAKANPAQVTCGTSGIGTTSHLICEMLNQQLGTKISSVPYKGGIPAITDVMGGQTTFVAVNEALPYIKDKRLKGIAVSSTERSQMAPDLPTIAETVPGVSLVSWYGIFAPAGTPQEIVDTFSTAIATAIKNPAMKERLDSLGATPVGSTSKEFTSFISSEFVKWEKVVRPLNIRLD